jgi:hypothetical protein
MQLEVLGELKNLVMSSEIEPAPFRLIVPEPTTLPRVSIPADTTLHNNSFEDLILCDGRLSVISDGIYSHLPLTPGG